MQVPVSIIVPTRNEAASIGACVLRILAACPASEVLVVDGGNDETESVLVRDPRVRYVRNANDRGKGHAVSVGIRASRFELMAQIDSDLQFLPEELPRLLAPIVEGRADVALGSRFAHGSRRESNSVPGARAAGNRLVSAYASLLARHPMTDVLAGMKAWRRAVTDSFTWTSDDYCYEAELPVKALRRGFRVVDVPITTHERAYGTSTVPVIRTAARLCRDILRFAVLPP